MISEAKDGKALMSLQVDDKLVVCSKVVSLVFCFHILPELFVHSRGRMGRICAYACK